jgi:tetratricopeptide (TPR) repeat protein
VRIDYAAESPSPAEQIKQAIFKVTAEAGHWTRAGSAVEGESLWEFLHHRGDLLRDANGETLLPLLIFDQFEEIFTLAQADDAGRKRAKAFFEELADLVENRPPADLERRLDNDEANADDFDFARADYRILISLREDYLAHLESVKGTMPSITQNRMRLARMTGAQALTAVTQPGGRLVSQEVAESIVRFVAGGSELPNAEVEPSLLSLICRELNTVRLAQGKKEISADLLAGSRDTILSEFYERALADQPAGVRRVIEDELLTESGYRESLAEERVAKALAAAGAAPDALAKLVDRRLLRIEERLDMRRVELTHDVLCGVVRSSRNLRHEREARDEAEKQLVAQQERAAETRRTLRKTRRFAMIAAGLMLVALVSAVFGWINWNRAKAADAQAQKARADAEKLVGFLIEDFYAELEPTGRLETMGKLAHMAVSYYDGLPKQLMTPQTRAYRGMALVREGHALLAKGDAAAGESKLDEAEKIFSALRQAGDKGEQVALGLALAKFTHFTAWGVTGSPGAKASDLPDAEQLLRPFIDAGTASRQTRLVYADVLNYYSHRQTDKNESIAMCERARKILVGLGATDLTDLNAASVYADTADSESRHAMQVNRVEDAARLSAEVYDIAAKVLAQRPGDLRSMANRALASGFLVSLSSRQYDFTGALAQSERAMQAAESYVAFNPSNLGAWDYPIRGYQQNARLRLELGQVDEALATLRAGLEMQHDKRLPSSLLPQLGQLIDPLQLLQVRAGDEAAASKLRPLVTKSMEESLAMLAPEDPTRIIWPMFIDTLEIEIDLYRGDYDQAYRRAGATIARVDGVEPVAGSQGARDKKFLVRRLLSAAGYAALFMGRPDEAVSYFERRIVLPLVGSDTTNPLVEKSRLSSAIAHARVKQGNTRDALTQVQESLGFYRDASSRGGKGLTFNSDYAYALYVDAIARPPGDAQRARNLQDAHRLLAELSPAAQRLADVRRLKGWIAAAESNTST